MFYSCFNKNGGKFFPLAVFPTKSNDHLPKSQSALIVSDLISIIELKTNIFQKEILLDEGIVLIADSMEVKKLPEASFHLKFSSFAHIISEQQKKNSVKFTFAI